MTPPHPQTESRRAILPFPMNPFIYLPTDLHPVLFEYFSEKSLSIMRMVSKQMGALAFDEAVQRHFGDREEYENAVTFNMVSIKELTRQGAYLFLARPGTKKLRLWYAAESQDMDMILLALQTGANDYYNGCVQAAKYGDYSIAMLLFEKVNVCYAPELLHAAYMGGNRDLIDFFTELESPPNWNAAVKGACAGGHVDLLEEIFDKYTGTLEALVTYACCGRDDGLAMVKHLVEKKKIVITDCKSIGTAITSDKHGLANFLLDTFPKVDTTEAFKTACKYGSMEFVQRLLPGSEHCIREGFEIACRSAQTKVMRHLSKLITVDWNAALMKVGTNMSKVNYSVIDSMWHCMLKGATNVTDAIDNEELYDPDDLLDVFILASGDALIEIVRRDPALSPQIDSLAERSYRFFAERFVMFRIESSSDESGDQ